MKKALRHKLEKLVNASPQDFAGIDVKSVELYLDLDDPMDIIKILSDNKAKFKTIVREILAGRYNDTLYKKEDECVSAMRFSGNPNSRIYCLEVPGKNGSKKKIVMAKALVHKNVQKNDKRIEDLIAAIKKSNYHFYESIEEANKH